MRQSKRIVIVVLAAVSATSFVAARQTDAPDPPGADRPGHPAAAQIADAATAEAERSDLFPAGTLEQFRAEVELTFAELIEPDFDRWRERMTDRGFVLAPFALRRVDRLNRDVPGDTLDERVAAEWNEARFAQEVLASARIDADGVLAGHTVKMTADLGATNHSVRAVSFQPRGETLDRLNEVLIAEDRGGEVFSVVVPVRGTGSPLLFGVDFAHDPEIGWFPVQLRMHRSDPQADAPPWPSL